LVNEEGLHKGAMVCVEHVSTTILKGGEIHKASYSNFLFLTKIRRIVNFNAGNAFMEIGEYKKEVEYIYSDVCRFFFEQIIKKLLLRNDW